MFTTFSPLPVQVELFLCEVDARGRLPLVVPNDHPDTLPVNILLLRQIEN